MSRYVSETKAASALSAYVILNKRGEYVAKVQMHHANSCTVNVFQSGKALERSEAAAKRALGKLPADGLGFQHGRASGYGYDKATSALAGLIIDGHVMADHSSSLDAPKPPKGRKLYPRDSKPRPGYTFANYSTRRKSDGRHIHPHTWTDAALAELNLESLRSATDAECEIVARRADEMAEAFAKSDDIETGYLSCFREPGLRYLESLGYRVLRAI